MGKPCKDCPSDSKRDTPYPGPRCYTHHKAKKARDAERARDRRMCQTYGLKPGEWLKLLEAQGFKCAICGLPFTKTRPPDLDHDHKTGFARGALCKSDNRKVLPYAKDDPARLRAAANYLENPIAIRILGYRKAKDANDGS